jgi:peptidoglycan/LPS O-acetylase OafA/YrhL
LHSLRTFLERITPHKNKILYLEGLRGAAALSVVVHHFLLAFFPAFHSGVAAESHFANNRVEAFIAESPLSILYSGNFAVCIFFVLSGYVLSHRYFETGKLFAVNSMLIKRYPRLIIPVAISSLIAFVLLINGRLIHPEAALQTKSWWLSSLWPTPPTFVHFIKTTFIRVPLYGNSDYNTVLWTMRTEIFGSIVVGCLCMAVHFFRGRNYLIYFAALITCVMLKWFTLAGFCVGVLLCDPALKMFYNKIKTGWKFLLVLVIIIFASYPAIEFKNFDSHWLRGLNLKFLYPDENMELWHMIAASLLLLLLLSSVRAQNFFSRPFFHYLGKISFPMYLLHVILICGGIIPLFLWLSKTLGQHYLLNSSIVFLIYLGTLLLCSHFFYKWVDKKAIRLSALIASKILRNSNPKET